MNFERKIKETKTNATIIGQNRFVSREVKQKIVFFFLVILKLVEYAVCGSYEGRESQRE